MTLKLLLTLHALSTIIWVGGMFFAHMALRPAAQELLEPPQRPPLLHRTLSNFFPWVWVAVTLILISGFGIFLGIMQGKAGLYVHVMSAIGLVMTAIFAFIYFVPFRRMGAALAGKEFSAAGGQMALIRKLIFTNLILGLTVSVLGVAKPF